MQNLKQTLTGRKTMGDEWYHSDVADVTIQQERRRPRKRNSLVWWREKETKSFPWPSDDWTKIPNPTYPKALRQTDREWKGRRWGQTVISAFSASPIFSSLFNYSPHDTSETRAKVLAPPSVFSGRLMWERTKGMARFLKRFLPERRLLVLLSRKCLSRNLEFDVPRNGRK